MAPLQPPQETTAFSSSPAFGTPLHPIQPGNAQRPPPPPAFRPAITTILPILLPPPTLRPLAFRTFTKKHNLTLNTTALQALAAFIGRHCGSGWREEGTGEKVLEEVARIWKAENGPVIVEDNNKLKTILQTLQGCMSGGRIGPTKKGTNLSRQSSFAFGNDSAVDLTTNSNGPPSLNREGSSFGLSSLSVVSQDDEDTEDSSKDVRTWLKTISAFEQPRFNYDADKKHFTPVSSKPSLFPSPTHKTRLYKERFQIIHQRLQRNHAFQAPSFNAQTNTLRRQTSSMTDQQFYTITPIANLLGRGGSSHLLLGMLAIAPTGTLAINDLTGSISLDLQHATSMQGGDVQPYFCPGMIVLVDGVYEEDWVGAGSSGLGNTGGVGGTIGGRFLGFQVGGPPVEKREVSLSINLSNGDHGGGFGWTDFLGFGSERAVGQKMKKVERRLIGPEAECPESRRKVVILSEVVLDVPSTLSALRKVFAEYSAAEEPPMSFVLMGNFSSKAVMAGAGTGSIEYKELFNELAAVLSEFPSLLNNCTFVFVPGDNDPWASSFSAGGTTVIPKQPVPDLFTSRIKRVFANAKSDSTSKKDAEAGEAKWMSNPCRMSLFGPAHELVIFRDDISSRFRRNSILIGQAARAAPDVLPSTEAGISAAAASAINETPNIPSDQEGEGDAMSLDPPLPAAPTISPSQDQAKRLILSLLPQSTLSPFPLNIRPTNWELAPTTLSLYPLPHTLVIADAEIPAFALTFEGCHVLNPGRLVESDGGKGRKRKRVQWIEYDAWNRRGKVREGWLG